MSLHFLIAPCFPYLYRRWLRRCSASTMAALGHSLQAGGGSRDAEFVTTSGGILRCIAEMFEGRNCYWITDWPIDEGKKDGEPDDAGQKLYLVVAENAMNAHSANYSLPKR